MDLVAVFVDQIGLLLGQDFLQRSFYFLNHIALYSKIPKLRKSDFILN